MKMYMLKSFLMAILFLLGAPILRAQFDDVYYDPDKDNSQLDYSYTGDTSTPPEEDYGVTYYDDDAYDYYDDYDYYYASRLKRFHHPYYGFDFYDPVYTSYYYYDPFYSDAFYYPGSTIYISFGNYSYWNYRHWRRWNSWNSYNPWNTWCITPYNYFYSHNSWCGGNNNYWGGYNGYYNYSNYYNDYYSGCPFPIGNYNGITHTTVEWVNSGSTRGTYYGPRITGNTGSSPRGPIQPPGVSQPVYAGRDLVATPTDKPAEPSGNGVPGRTKSSNPITDVAGERPASIPASRDEAAGVSKTREVPIDKELKREDPSTPAKRPVFKPDTERYQPYPTNRTPDAIPNEPKPDTDRPTYRPYTPSRPVTPAKPDPAAERTATAKPLYNPARDDQKPAFRPSGNNKEERPSYSPPSRNENLPRNTPPSRTNNSGRNDDRPTYSPPPRNRESQSNESRPTSPSRNEDRSSSSRSVSPSHSSPSHSSPSPSRDSSSGSSRSSSSGSSNSGSSPRGKG